MSLLSLNALREDLDVSHRARFGALRRLGKETRHVQARIDETFEEVSPENRS